MSISICTAHEFPRQLIPAGASGSPQPQAGLLCKIRLALEADEMPRQLLGCQASGAAAAKRVKHHRARLR